MSSVSLVSPRKPPSRATSREEVVSSATPAGPPHVGPRDELLRTNKHLFAQLEQTKVELELARTQCVHGI